MEMVAINNNDEMQQSDDIGSSIHADNGAIERWDRGRV